MGQTLHVTALRYDPVSFPRRFPGRDAGTLAGMISVFRLYKAGPRWSGATACVSNYILYLRYFSNILNRSL